MTKCTPSIWHNTVKVKLTVKISSIFVVFLENTKFDKISQANKWSVDKKPSKITSSNTSCLEAHVGFFRLLMKGSFGPYVLWSFDKKLFFLISTVYILYIYMGQNIYRSSTYNRNLRVELKILMHFCIEKKK